MSGSEWIEQAPIRPTPHMQADAWASRRFPRPVPSPTVAGAWREVWDNIHIGINFDTSDERLRDVARRVLDRLPLEEPPPDPDADALLMAYALTTSEPYRKTALGVAVVDYLIAQYGVAMTVAIWLGAQAVEVGKRWNDDEEMNYHDFSLTVTQPLHNADFTGRSGRPRRRWRSRPKSVRAGRRASGTSARCWQAWSRSAVPRRLPCWKKARSAMRRAMC